MPVNTDDQWNLYIHQGEDEDYEGFESWLEMTQEQDESEAELEKMAYYFRHEWNGEQEQEGE